MKKILFALSLLWSCSAWAAYPTFLSFNTNDFLVAPPYIFLSRTNTGGTNVFINTTNIYDHVTINITDGSTVNITNSSITINGTNVSTINPTIGRVPYNFDGTNFYDTALYFIDTNTVGADQVFTYDLGVTNLAAGGFVVSIPTVGGYGVLTNAPFSTFSLWTNIANSFYPSVQEDNLFATNVYGVGTLVAPGAFIIQPGDGADLALGVNNLNVFDQSFFPLDATTTTPSDTRIRLGNGNGTGTLLVLQNIGDDAFELLNGDSLWDDPTRHLYLSGGDWKPDTRGESLLLIGSYRGWAEIGRFGGSTNVVVAPLTINPTDTFMPYRSNVTTFGDSPFAVISPGLVLQKSQLNVGTKGTIAYRTATNQSDITVETDIGGIQSVTYMGTGVGITTPLRVQVSGVPYFDVRNTGPVDFIGFDDGGGVNFSRGAIYHTGTNGFFVIESQANGTAGGARSIELVVDGDEVAIPYNPDTANTAYGFRAMNNANSSSQNNNSFGYNSLLSLTSGTENTAVGLASLLVLQTGHHNTAIGNATLVSNNGDLNTAVGNSAGYTNSTGTGNAYFGYNANPLAGSDNNSIVIGRDAVGKGSNTALIGNSSVTVLWLGGEVGWFKGTGSPEGAVTAPPGSFYSNKSGGANVSFYVKESGTGNTGWVAK